MFYNRQSEQQKTEYKQMLSLVGSLSNLFSASDEPMLHYRAHENIFCKFFEADNLSREDCSADASKGPIGIGLKTWVGRDDQKVAEFGRLRPNYENLSGLELIQTIGQYRNMRIRTTMNIHGLDEMIYHIVKRVPNAMKIYECAFDYIDIDNIVIDEHRGNENNTYFSDGHHTYHFSKSKNTLYMIFDDMELMDSFDVDIHDDPYEILKNLLPQTHQEVFYDIPDIEQPTLRVAEEVTTSQIQRLCLPLYALSRDGTKYVPERSGLNQWNARGRQRNPDELYIAYLADDRARVANFFPPRDTPFTLSLPNGNTISAKVCQAAYAKIPDEQYAQLTPAERQIVDERAKVGKSIMSNPNRVLGHWLLREVFELPENTIVTYDMLRQFGIDSVMFTKYSLENYSIDFCSLGTYERTYGLNDTDAYYDNDYLQE